MTIFLTQTEYAKHRGVSHQRISKLVGQGKFAGCLRMISGRRKIDRDKADLTLEQNLDPSKKTRSQEIDVPIDAAGTGSLTFAEAQKKQAQYRAALLQLEYDTKRGNLLDAQEVYRDNFNMARLIRDSVQNIPNRISAELASLTDIHKVHEIMTVAINEALEEIVVKGEALATPSTGDIKTDSKIIFKNQK